MEVEYYSELAFSIMKGTWGQRRLGLTWMVAGDPPLTRCLRSGGRMLSRIRFSCSRVALVGPWLLTTLEAGRESKGPFKTSRLPRGPSRAENPLPSMTTTAEDNPDAGSFSVHLI